MTARTRRSTPCSSPAIFGLGILPQALQRPDSTHLAWVAMVSWPLLAALITHAVSRFLRNSERSGPIVRLSVVSGAAVVLVLMLVVSPFYTYRYYLLHTRVSVGDLPLPFLVEREDRKFWFGNPEVANALIAMIPDLEERSEPGDTLVVGTADLSRTVYSDVSIYFLFDELDPGTYFIEMDPGLADAEGSGSRGGHRAGRFRRPHQLLVRLARAEHVGQAPVAGAQSGGRRQLLSRRPVRVEPADAVRAV